MPNAITTVYHRVFGWQTVVEGIQLQHIIRLACMCFSVAADEVGCVYLCVFWACNAVSLVVMSVPFCCTMRCKLRTS